MLHPPTIRKPAEGRTVAVVGDVYRFLATGEDTNGKYANWEAIVPPGGGPPGGVGRWRRIGARPRGPLPHGTCVCDRCTDRGRSDPLGSTVA